VYGVWCRVWGSDRFAQGLLEEAREPLASLDRVRDAQVLRTPREYLALLSTGYEPQGSGFRVQGSGLRGEIEKPDTPTPPNGPAAHATRFRFRS